MTKAIFNTRDIFKLETQDVQALVDEVHGSATSPPRLCLHKDASDAVHEMIIAHRRGAYLRPHKHPRKTESIHMIRGRLLVVVFDDRGGIIDQFCMGASTTDDIFLCRLEKDLWHMELPLTDPAVVHETLNGPFLGQGDNVFPPWAPALEDGPGIEAFLGDILARCAEILSGTGP